MRYPGGVYVDVLIFNHIDVELKHLIRFNDHGPREVFRRSGDAAWMAQPNAACTHDGWPDSDWPVPVHRQGQERDSGIVRRVPHCNRCWTEGRTPSSRSCNGARPAHCVH